MPNGSVWFEQVDRALLKLIPEIVKLKNDEGLIISVPAEVKKPDMDFRIISLPRITIYNVQSKRDEIRYDRNREIISRDYENHKLTVSKHEIPYNLIYQIEFWSRTQIHMNEMVKVWLASHPDRYFNLGVVDSEGNNKSTLALLMGNKDIVKADLLLGGERLFHSILTYRIYGSIEGAMEQELPMVTTIVLKEDKL